MLNSPLGGRRGIGFGLGRSWQSAAVSTDWWLAGGIDPANCIAAYQPIGAASYAASLVNLANPGTYDLTTASNPSWSSAVGWTFPGGAAANILNTNYTLPDNYHSVFIKLIARSTGGGGYGKAYSSTSDSFSLIPWSKSDDGLLEVKNGGAFQDIGNQITSMSVVGCNYDTVYKDGVVLGSLTPTAHSEALHIGNRPSDSARCLDGDIEYFVVYDTKLTHPQALALSAEMDGNTIDLYNKPLLLSFDDGRADFYTNVYPLLQEYNIKVTNFLASDLLDTAGYITTAQATEMHDSGLVAFGNHSKDHSDLTTLTQAQIETNLTACKSALDAKELTGASNHVAYPYGKYNNEVLAAMSSLDYPTGRAITVGRSDIEYVYENSEIHTIDIKYPKIDVTLDTVKGWIDEAVLNNYGYNLLFHSIVDSPSDTYDWATSDFEALLEYIIASNLTTETIAEWYTRYIAKYS